MTSFPDGPQIQHISNKSGIIFILYQREGAVVQVKAEAQSHVYRLSLYKDLKIFASKGKKLE